MFLSGKEGRRNELSLKSTPSLSFHLAARQAAPYKALGRKQIPIQGSAVKYSRVGLTRDTHALVPAVRNVIGSAVVGILPAPLFSWNSVHCQTCSWWVPRGQHWSCGSPSRPRKRTTPSIQSMLVELIHSAMNSKYVNAPVQISENTAGTW